ncbi:MAG: hypothetical protein R2795_02170 [Saprospiraceae bacterium]
MNQLILLTSLFLAICNGVSAQSIDWVTDYTGSTSYRAPRGWVVTAGQQEGVYTWQAEESPGAADSPGLLVMALNRPGGSLLENSTYILNQVVSDLRINEQQSRQGSCTCKPKDR